MNFYWLESPIETPESFSHLAFMTTSDRVEDSLLASMRLCCH